jgi:hypothetical protein
MITLELGFCWIWDTKLDQIDLNFLYVLLKDVGYNFYFGIKPSYLMTKTAVDSIFKPQFHFLPS